MLATKKGIEPDEVTKLWIQNSKSTDCFNRDHQRTSLCLAVCVSTSICLLQHRPHTDFLWGHTYPSWGRRTSALGRSSTDALMIVSRKSPSGLAT